MLTLVLAAAVPVAELSLSQAAFRDFLLVALIAAVVGPPLIVAAEWRALRGRRYAHCPGCGTSDHARDARHCCRCGARLPE